MKVILLQDVYKKGVAGEVVEVAPGFARNFLIPRGLATKATPGAMRQAENLRKHAVARRAERTREFGKLAEQIRGIMLYFAVRAGETGKLYGSVTAGEIADAIKAQVGIEIDRRRVGDRPLRELGEFMVPIRLDADLAPQVKVIVFREGHDPREKETAGPVGSVEAVETAEPAEVVSEAAPESELADTAPAE